MAEVGGVRSSDDSVPDLWSGQPAEERRDATCSAEVKSSEGRGDGPQGLQAPNKRSATANHAGSESVGFPVKELGKPDAGKAPVRFDEGREADGHWPSGLSIRRFPPTLHWIIHFGAFGQAAVFADGGGGFAGWRLPRCADSNAWPAMAFRGSLPGSFLSSSSVSPAMAIPSAISLHA